MMAMRFNIDNPADMARVEQFLDILPTRSMEAIEALHYLHATDGFHCLDLSLVAQSEDELDLAVRKLLPHLRGVLPSAPRSLWLRFCRANPKSYHHLRRMPAVRTLIVTLCSEVD